MTDNYKERLTIIFEHSEGKETVTHERKAGLKCDTLFWEWFQEAWPALGLDFVKKGLEIDG